MKPAGIWVASHQYSALAIFLIAIIESLFVCGVAAIVGFILYQDLTRVSLWFLLGYSILMTCLRLQLRNRLSVAIAVTHALYHKMSDGDEEADAPA